VGEDVVGEVVGCIVGEIVVGEKVGGAAMQPTGKIKRMREPLAGMSRSMQVQTAVHVYPTSNNRECDVMRQLCSVIRG